MSKYVYQKDYGQTTLFDETEESLTIAQREFDNTHDIQEEFPNGLRARPVTGRKNSELYRSRFTTEDRT